MNNDHIKTGDICVDPNRSVDLMKKDIELFFQKNIDDLKLIDFYNIYCYFCKLGRSEPYYLDTDEYKTSVIETEKGIENIAKFVLKLLNYGISRNTATADVRVDYSYNPPIGNTAIIIRELENPENSVFENDLYFNIWLPSNYEKEHWSMAEFILNSVIRLEGDYAGIEINPKIKNYYFVLKEEIPENLKSWLLLNGIDVF